MAHPDYPKSPIGRVQTLEQALMIDQNLDAQYNNGFLPEPQYRAEKKVIRKRIQELSE